MSLRRALQISRLAVPLEGGSRAAIETKPWSRRGWTREQLRSHWPHLTIQQVELLKEVFQLFDTEDKGYFTKDDLFFVMEAMGGSPTPQELDAVMYELDSNGDSVVDFPEFLTKFLTATDEKELLSVFNQLAIQEGEDDDRVLTLTAVERSFQYVGERLTDEDKKYLEIIFKGADKDGNGRLDIKEFTAYLEKMDDELFMGQAGALGNLLAAANTSGAAAAAKSLRRGGGGGGSAGACASQRRSAGEDGEPGAGGAAADGAGGSGAAGGGTDAEAAGAGARLTNSQLLAMATHALSNRGAAGGFMFGGGGGLGDDMESVSSHQGGLRNSFLAKLTRGRRKRRSSVNSSTIAALAGQLASMGVTGGGAAALRVGSVSSAAALAAANLLQPEASEGVRSVSSARTGMYSHFGGAPPPPPAAPGGGATHFIVERSSVSALRLVSSTGQLPAFMFPEDMPQGAVAATAPVALSRGGSFGDGAGAQEPGSQDGGQAPGARAGPGPQHQHQRPGWAPGGAAAAASGGCGVGNHGGGGRTPPLQQQSPHPYPHRSPSQQQVQPPVFCQMRSRSMPSTAAAAASAAPPTGLSVGLVPLAIPAGGCDPDEPLSGSASPFSATPGSASAAFAAAGAAAAGGGSAVSERGGVHSGYSGRSAGSGLRSPVPSWQKASVIQEAPEEGNSGYGGMDAAAAAGPALGPAGQRWDHHGGRTSAPTRFGRLTSFPERLPLQADLAAGGGAAATTAGDGAGGGVTDGRSSAGAIVRGNGSGGGGTAPPPWPLRFGSGGEGRLSHRIGGLMTAMFGRERSLGHGTAGAARDPEADPRSGTTEPGARRSPSKAQLSLSRPPAAQAGSDDARISPHGAAAAPAPAPTSSSWGFAAGARAAMGWLRRARSLGQSRAGGRGAGGFSSGGAGTSSGGADVGDAAHGDQPPWLPPPLPPAAAAVAAGSGRVPPWRLSVQVPGSDSFGSSKPTSPADIEASPGPSAGTSSVLSPGPSYLASPFTSPVAAAARTVIAGGGLTSPPPALITDSGSDTAAAVAAAAGPAALGTPEAGPMAPGGVSAASPSDASLGTGRPSASSPRAAHVAALQPPCWRPGSPQGRSSAPGSSPWLLTHQQHQQPQYLSSPGIPPPEPAAAAPPVWLPPPLRPAPSVPTAVSVSSRMGGAAGARGLNRSGSVGGSSRLAVSSARDSPPVAPCHMQRQQPSPTHHLSPLAPPQQPPQPPHRLSQQGLPQLPLYPHHPTAQHPRSGLQSPHEPDQQQQQLPFPQPHRLSCSGLPHGAPQYGHQQPPSPRTQPQPSPVVQQQPQQRPGDWGPYSPSGPGIFQCPQPLQQQQQLQQARPGPESAAPSTGGAGSGAAPSSAREAAASSAALAAATGAAGAQGSARGALHSAAHGHSQATGPHARVGSSAGAGAGGDGAALDRAPQRQPGWQAGVQQAAAAHLGGSYGPPPQQPYLGSGLRREASEPVLRESPPDYRQDYRREHQQQHKPQEGPQQQWQRQQH
ncbi:hypothetical protein PLESTB_001084000 [Pleodorina starrii]|uniref:EF-hand domain-containing protein n=1 Tax=Pleodorina starrii TaxID=330485 RepID=A0A9W6BQQ8_9CHLO|nr:hypothetical protein PLESTM_001174800 [Pleodorina starrii]GLC56245.1 hypothetical protein PLESTB_001084000 [Pleodorina starrii]GLC69121.1 hypothetical protein PLESTF_000792200 [Pleodorina starrii]